MNPPGEDRTTASPSSEESNSDKVAEEPTSAGPSSSPPGRPGNSTPEPSSLPRITVSPPPEESNDVKESSEAASSERSNSFSGPKNTLSPSSSPFLSPARSGRRAAWRSISIAGPSTRAPSYGRIDPPRALHGDTYGEDYHSIEYSSMNDLMRQGALAPLGETPELPKTPTDSKDKGKGKEKEEPFDAAKTGKIPESARHTPPKWEPSVSVKLVSEKIGLGLVAARDFSQGEWILEEAPTLAVQYVENPFHFRTRALMEQQFGEWQRFTKIIFRHGPWGRMYGTEILKVTYPRFVTNMGLALSHWNRAAWILDHGLQLGLVRGLQGPGVVEREEYEQWIGKINFHTRPSEYEERKAVRDFFRHYAFMDDGAAQAQLNSNNPNAVRGAYFYLLGSLINHRCTPASDKLRKIFSSPPPDLEGRGPNCEFIIGPVGLADFNQPTHLAVRALRDIPAGEELTINYGKRKSLGFICRCVDCDGSLKNRWLDRMKWPAVKARAGAHKARASAEKAKERLRRFYRRKIRPIPDDGRTLVYPRYI